jgi:hypothetical protein
VILQFLTLSETVLDLRQRRKRVPVVVVLHRRHASPDRVNVSQPGRGSG